MQVFRFNCPKRTSLHERKILFRENSGNDICFSLEVLVCCLHYVVFNCFKNLISSFQAKCYTLLT